MKSWVLIFWREGDSYAGLLLGFLASVGSYLGQRARGVSFIVQILDTIVRGLLGAWWCFNKTFLRLYLKIKKLRVRIYINRCNLSPRAFWNMMEFDCNFLLWFHTSIRRKLYRLLIKMDTIEITDFGSTSDFEIRNFGELSTKPL